MGLSAPEQKEYIYQYFMNQENQLADSLEIIANLLIQLGVDHMDTEVMSDDITAAILSDRRTNGETIANATALQGMNILNWLSS